MKMQIFPAFKEIKIVTDLNCYEQIYESEQKSKSAWLLDEKSSIWEFIEQLYSADSKSSNSMPLNLHDFYIAYNIEFPPESVTLMNGDKIHKSNLKNFLELLDLLIRSQKKNFFVSIKSSARSSELKLKILQQFIYLRIYIPVNISTNLESSVDNSIEIGIFGTKKAGKSALINSILGDEYAVSSPMIPTPNIINYSSGEGLESILCFSKNFDMKFQNTEDLQKFLRDRLESANKKSLTLEDMFISIPKFPRELSKIELIDTPGSNFAGNRQHGTITQKMIDHVELAIFVMNYSQYLTQDEIQLFDSIYRRFNNSKTQTPILIVINRVDELFDSDESKSYERVEDYICFRLNALGYQNFLVFGFSAIQSFYFQIVSKILEPRSATIFDRIQKFFQRLFSKPIPLIERVSKLKDESRGSDKFSAIAFVGNIISDFEDFHGITIYSVEDLKKIDRLDYLKCLICNLKNICST